MKNWFNNQTERKKDRLPFSIRRGWTARTVYACQKAEKVWNRAKLKAAADRKRRPPIAFHARSINALFKDLSPEEQEAYAETATEWNVRGPDQEFKARCVQVFISPFLPC